MGQTRVPRHALVRPAGCTPGKKPAQVCLASPPRWTQEMLLGDYMDGDHAVPREGIMPIPTGTPHLHNVSAPSPPGVPSYPNMGVHLPYNVFGGKGAPPSPAFYANGVPPGYPGIYVAPQVRYTKFGLLRTPSLRWCRSCLLIMLTDNLFQLQPAVMYSPHPFYPSMVPFPGAFPAHLPAQDAEEKKFEERKPKAPDARAVRPTLQLLL